MQGRHVLHRLFSPSGHGAQISGGGFLVEQAPLGAVVPFLFNGRRPGPNRRSCSSTQWRTSRKITSAGSPTSWRRLARRLRSMVVSFLPRERSVSPTSISNSGSRSSCIRSVAVYSAGRCSGSGRGRPWAWMRPIFSSLVWAPWSRRALIDSFSISCSAVTASSARMRYRYSSAASPSAAARS